MQYAQIAVKAKTSLNRQIFTYKIKPDQLPYIKPGVLVSVPFNNKYIEGIVISLKHQSNILLKNKIKSIIKITDTEPIVSIYQIELANKIADYYLYPLGEVLFMMIPPVAKRQIQKQYSKFQIEKIDKITVKPLYLIYDSNNNRIIKYIEIIKKSLINNKGIIIIFPKNELAERFLRFTDNKISNAKPILFHGALTLTERYKRYKEILNGKYNIVIGSRQTIFAPVKNLGLIIIDRPEDFSYKDDQAPKYNAINIANIISTIKNINIIHASIIPTIKDFVLVSELKAKYILNKINDFHISKDIILIDQNNEKSLISAALELKINKHYKKSKILIYCPVKGEGSGLVCADCGYHFDCPRCNMHFGIIKNKLRCFKCNSIATIPESCPNCGNVKLISSGIGTQKIKNKLTELFPNTKLSIIEENNNLSKEIYNNSDIIVATKKIINSGFYFDFTALINIDGMFNFPDYNTNENIIFDLANLLAITKKEMLIQTFYPDNFILQNLKYPKIIYKKILEERKKYLYPPYAKIIKLIFKNKDEKICQKETEKLLKSLSNINYKNKFEIIGFGPSFINKKRDLYFYQIIIKYLPQKETQVKKLLSLENQLGKWIIDVDPVNLI